MKSHATQIILITKSTTQLIDKNETIQLIGSINWANHLLIAYSTLHKHSSFPPQIVYDKNVNPIYHNRRFGKEKKIERVLKGASKNDWWMDFDVLLKKYKYKKIEPKHLSKGEIYIPYKYGLCTLNIIRLIYLSWLVHFNIENTS